MPNQTATLQALKDGPREIDDLVAELCPSGGRKCRKQVLECLGRLMQNGFARRHDVKSTAEALARNRDGVQPVYTLTDAGRDAARSGRRITSGPNGPLTGTPKPRADTLRERGWQALRMMPGKRATLPDIVEAIRRPGDAKPEAAIENLRRYFGDLVRAGVAVKMGARAEGFAPTSNGFIRFALIDDLGPQAPVLRKGQLFNPNDGSKRPLGAAQPAPSKRKAV